MLYRILLVSAKHQHEWAIGIHMSPPSWTSLPSPSPFHPSRLLQSPCLSPLSHIANSIGYLFLHMVICFHVTLHSSHPLLPPPAHVHKSILYICDSLAALQIISSVPSLVQAFLIPVLQCLVKLISKLIVKYYFHYRKFGRCRHEKFKVT